VCAKNHRPLMKRGGALVVVPYMNAMAATTMKVTATMKWTFGKELAANGALGLFASAMLVLLLRGGI
jgi:hypothetical protein